MWRDSSEITTVGWSAMCRNMIKTNASSWGQKSSHLATEYSSISPLNRAMINWTSSAIKKWMSSCQSLNSQGRPKRSSSCLMYDHLLVYLSATVCCHVFFPPGPPPVTDWSRFELLSPALRLSGGARKTGEANGGNIGGSAIFISGSTDTPSAPSVWRLGPVAPPTNLWFWPTFWPHPSQLSVPETHSFPMNPIYSSQAAVSSLQTYLLPQLQASKAKFEYFIMGR